ncbi:MAG: MBL fold metallo-hydrolase [Firmicutes bacterium]|nr:MBL fold metallo-hydrolase [Bacillota bacterium]
MAKGNSTKKHRWPLRIALMSALTLVLGLSLIWHVEIDRVIGLIRVEEGAYTGQHSAAEVAGGRSGGDLTFHFVDVGQGDACIVELPDKRTMIIDAGPAKHKDSLLTYIDDNFVKGKSEAERLTKFDFAVLTHSDEDHCGGFPDVLKTYGVGTFYRPNELSTRAPFIDPDADSIVGTGKKDTVVYQKTIEAAYQASDNVAVTYAPDLDTGGLDRITPEGIAKGDERWYEIVFFGPYGHSYKDLNNYSPIIVIEYNGQSVALSGDAEKAAEKEFVDNAKLGRNQKFGRFTADYSVSLIKLGHHGSRTSSGDDYLRLLTSASVRGDVLTVISCGFGNSYGHPHAEVLSRLTGLGFSEGNLLRTDAHSNIVYSIPGSESKPVFGATSHNVEAAAVHEAVSWLTVALCLWLLSLSVILFAPILAAKRD